MNTKYTQEKKVIVALFVSILGFFATALILYFLVEVGLLWSVTSGFLVGGALFFLAKMIIEFANA